MFLFLACTQTLPKATPIPYVAPASFATAELSGANVVVIQVDTLRGDHLGQAGYFRDTMPRLDEREWVVIEGFQTTTSWTPPSAASALTGLAPHEHGILWTTDPDSRSCNGTITDPVFPERFQEAGYATFLGTGNAFLGESTGMDRGFDHAQEIGPAGAINAAVIVDVFQQWLGEQSGEQPFFALLQPMNPHGPYQPDAADLGTWADLSVLPEPYPEGGVNPELESYQQAFAAGDDADDAALTEAVVGLYDETLLGLDRSIDDLLDWLDAEGYQNTLVVFTSDHGETLNDDGSLIFNHGRTLRAEGLHVPLRFYHPRLEPEQITCLSDNRSLLATAADLVGVPGIDGVASLRDGCAEVVTSSLWLPNDELRSLAIEDGQHRLTASCETGQLWGSDLVSDPFELVPLDPTELPSGEAWTAALVALLAEIQVSEPNTVCRASPF